MNRPARQFAAAASAYDNASPPEPDDRDPSDAVSAIADRDVANWNVGEVYEDLYGGGDTAGALDRLIRGRSPHFGDASVLQTLLRRLQSLHRDVEKEMHA